MFDEVESWPNTNLIFINIDDMTLEMIKRTDSSWNVSAANHVDESKYSIGISPDQTIEYKIP